MFDLVLSDMAPNTTGAPKLDHLRIMGLTEAAFEFCQKSLKPGGHFIAKIFMGGEEQKMAATLRKHFTTVKFIKPESSRKDSKEVFLVGLNFK
jgi:23S rRNA (uridine2552-2'-O)-methyltransferase